VTAVTKAAPAESGLTTWKVLTAIASLRLTVTLFFLSILLVFFGTLAQVDQGLYTVLHRYFRTGIAWIPSQVFVTFGQKFLDVPPTVKWTSTFPFPGGWLLGTLLLVNLVTAHGLLLHKWIRAYGWSAKLGAVLLKRTGIFLLHGGIVLIMLGELITGVFATESFMEITEGASANFIYDSHKVELAVIDPSNPKTDDVLVVPGSWLRKGAPISNPELPFDVEVVHYMINSELANEPPPGKSNPATAGYGRNTVAIERGEYKGTESRRDAPSAYVILKRKSDGKSLGTYLLTTLLRTTQSVTVDGKRYEVALRFKRTYKPFSLHLLKFRFDRYPGSNIAKNYSSRVRLVDPEQHEDREVVIKMNEPLRYRGDTYYQAGFDENTEKATVLQVVHNPGWLMPYISCVLVAVGMIIHFLMHLVGFLGRRAVQ
jgi:hypothetical protein